MTKEHSLNILLPISLPLLTSLVTPLETLLCIFFRSPSSPPTLPFPSSPTLPRDEAAQPSNRPCTCSSFPPSQSQPVRAAPSSSWQTRVSGGCRTASPLSPFFPSLPLFLSFLLPTLHFCTELVALQGASSIEPSPLSPHPRRPKRKERVEGEVK